MVLKGMLGASEAGDVAADLHQFSGTFNKETPLASSLHLLQQRGSPLTAMTRPPIAHHTWGTQQGICRHKVPGMDRWEHPEQHLRTCFSPDGNPQVSSAVPQTHPPPKNSASCFCFCFAIKRQENSSSYHPCPEWKNSFPHVHCCTFQMPFGLLLFFKYLTQLSRVGQT